ncbi:CAS1 domain-containing 1 [Brachionus plicatilis]|uniref:CAS1 domain-containing 1 n=1 Tax=Brachionus plicatilis TaxID=10195 RepID=A0A3M7T940_BRAPC|nr:CAS1 domain-containing 1 [Brachionus plicatilis]
MILKIENFFFKNAYFILEVQKLYFFFGFLMYLKDFKNNKWPLLNFLPIMLCFAMNRMYQFYEFIPVITFWFIVAYLVMVIYPRVSENTAKENCDHYIYMLLKLLIVIGLITILNLSENVFEKIFMARLWKFLFIDSDYVLNVWRKNWSANCYSFVFGMIFALICCFLRKKNLIDDYENNLEQHEDDNLEFREKRRDKFALSLKKKIVLVFISIIGLFSSIFFVLACKSKDQCDIYIPYLMIVPVVSYFILRNTLQFLREKCSFIFSWFGKISLELYVCSYHIWLAADASGVLILLPDYTVLNSIITIFMFSCISHELNKLTRCIGEYLFPNSSWKTCLKNSIIFSVLLLPIAIKHGYLNKKIISYFVS